MPKMTFDTLDAIPEGLREHAASEGGKFTVDVSPTAKLTEFRDNNVKFLRERDEAQAKLKAYSTAFGDDIAKATTELSELRGISQQVTDGKLKASGDIATEVEKRVKEARTQFETQLRESGQRLAEAEAKATLNANKYRGSVRDNAISAAVMAADSGVNPQALADIVARAEKVFVVEDDGRLTAMQNGEKWYGADGASTVSVKEWMGHLLKEAPYLGKASAGGGGSERGQGRIKGYSDAAVDAMTPEQRLDAHWNPKAA